MKQGYRIVDADAHVIEPSDLWQRHLDPALRARGPRHLNLAFSVETDGIPINTPERWDPEATPERLALRDARIQATFAEIFPRAAARGFDGVAQLEDMDVEGVDVAFLYPSYGLFVTASDAIEPSLASAIARAYNDWLAAFCAVDPKRLRGVGMVALQDPEAAANEAARVADRYGFRSVFARPNPILGRNLDDPAYDPLWAVLSARRMAIGLHEGGMPPLPQAGADRLRNAEQRHICSHPMEQMVAAVGLIYGGVLERFPAMTVAFLEAGCGWVPFWLERMDDHYEKGLARDFGAAKRLSMAPSAYFRRQCFVSADADESMLAQVIDLIGDDRIVFSTDYPHPDSKYPHAVDAFLALPGVAPESKRRILWDNALALYGLEGAEGPTRSR